MVVTIGKSAKNKRVANKNRTPPSFNSAAGAVMLGQPEGSGVMSSHVCLEGILKPCTLDNAPPSVIQRSIAWNTLIALKTWNI